MIKKLTYILIASCITLSAQSTYEPTYKTDIYNFLERLANKNQINLFADIRPLTRQQIAQKLSQLDTAELTSIVKSRLDFYMIEYAEEIKYILGDTTSYSNFFGSEPIDRFNLYKFYNEKFSLTIDPVIGIGYNFSDKIYHQYGGIQMRGRIADNWGFYFNLSLIHI